jgi:ferrous iron transport protein B
MSDLAKKQGITVKTEELERRLGIPVVVLSAVKGNGLETLLTTLQKVIKQPQSGVDRSFTINNNSERILERYTQIEQTLKSTVEHQKTARDVTRAIDKVVLHRVFGPLLMLAAFAFMFQLIFSVAQIPMDAIAKGVSLLQNFMREIIPSGIFQSLIADGIVAGVGSVVTFLPQIILLFGFILFFEDSGYMARAAFILDKLMSKVGLHGRAGFSLGRASRCSAFIYSESS